MQNFDIARKNKIENVSFRVSKIQADFDVMLDKANEHFKGEIVMPNQWNIGVIVGGSGTGKSTIAKELWGNEYIKSFDYAAQSVIDDMPKDVSVDDITKMFYSVGFGSVPSWLKPYRVLSNGEQMRVDLARALLEREFVVFDEFTSVVDRQVAQTTCIAINKAIKKSNKKFIAISCHYDILEWLQPDWVFDTNEMKGFFYERPRPQKEFAIKPCGQEEWAKFSKYHYLSNDLAKAAKCFGLYDDDKIIGFCGVLHQPHGKNKKLKRCSRLVVLPDYQGIGLGTKFLNEIAKHYSSMGYDFTIVTSAKNMIMALKKSSKWTMIRYGVNKCSSSKSAIDNNRTSMRSNCKTASFMYKNEMI